MSGNTLVSVGLPALVITALVAAAPVAAQDAAAPAAPPQKQQAWQKSCAADIEKLCKTAANVPECLAGKEAELGEECKTTFLYKYQVTQLCKDDIEKLCKPKMAQGMSLGECFKQHQKDLSEKCQAAIKRGSRQFKSEQKTEAPAAEAPAPAGRKKAADKKP